MPFSILKSFLTHSLKGGCNTGCQDGGKLKGTSSKGMVRKQITLTYVLLISLVELFIKALIVQWAYNKVVPKMFVQAQELEYVDALALVVLVISLFN